MQLCQLGPISICPHTLSVVLAIGLGLSAFWLTTKVHQLDSGLAVDAALVAFLVAIVAGRLECILVNLDYFRERPRLMVHFEYGGLGHRSMIVTGVIVYLGIIKRHTNDWWAYSDSLAPALALAASVAWAGASLSGRGAGAPSNGVWAISLRDEFGVVAPRFPFQPAMALTHLTVGALLVLASRLSRQLVPPGLALPLWGAITSAASASLDSYRAQVTLLFGSIPRPLAADILLAIAWLLIALIVACRPKRLFGLTGSKPESPSEMEKPKSEGTP